MDYDFKKWTKKEKEEFMILFNLAADWSMEMSKEDLIKGHYLHCELTNQLNCEKCKNSSCNYFQSML